MTTEEKLENFYNHSIESAHKEAERLITEHQAALDQLFSEHKATRTRQAAAELTAEKEKLKRENNKALSTEQLQIKRAHSLKNMELKNKLFAEVEEKLQAFKKTEEYETYLCQKIQEAAEFAQQASVEYYLDPTDSALAEELSKKAAVPVRVYSESFMGGLLAIIPARHILIDHSFSAMLREERETFIFEGGHVHE